MLDLERGRWQDAAERFETVARVNSVHEMRVAADRVEAAVRAGRPDHARETTAAFAFWQEHTGSPWAAPRVASCRALLAEGEEATAQFGEALGLVTDARPFDRARIHLLYGEHLRRERHRAEARTHLRAALEEFERFR